MSNTPTDIQAASNLPSQVGDPLQQLHRMSRTAGLGTTDYVAVSPTAVTALFLGLGSVLSLFGTILLLLPAAAVAIAVLAIVQVRRSAGTQKGVGIAGLGLALAVLFVGVVGGREVIRQQHEHADQQAIAALLVSLGDEVSHGQYDKAYSRFNSRFKDQVTLQAFTDLWTRMQASPYYGNVKAMRWNSFLDVRDDAETGTTTAEGFVLIDLDKGTTDRREASFRKDKNTGLWLVEELQGLAPQPAAPKHP